MLLHSFMKQQGHNDDMSLNLLVAPVRGMFGTFLLDFSSLEEIVPAGQVNKNPESQNRTLINIEA